MQRCCSWLLQGRCRSRRFFRKNHHLPSCDGIKAKVPWFSGMFNSIFSRAASIWFAQPKKSIALLQRLQTCKPPPYSPPSSFRQVWNRVNQPSHLASGHLVECHAPSRRAPSKHCQSGLRPWWEKPQNVLIVCWKWMIMDYGWLLSVGCHIPFPKQNCRDLHITLHMSQTLMTKMNWTVRAAQTSEYELRLDQTKRLHFGVWRNSTVLIGESSSQMFSQWMWRDAKMPRLVWNLLISMSCGT